MVPGLGVQPHLSIVGSFWRWGDKPFKIVDYCLWLQPSDHDFCVHKEFKEKNRYYYIEWKMRTGDGIMPMDSYITEQELFEAD